MMMTGHSWANLIQALDPIAVLINTKENVKIILLNSGLYPMKMAVFLEIQLIGQLVFIWPINDRI